MKRTAAFASFFALALAAGVAQAQAQAPLDGRGRAPADGGVVMGGGGASMYGGGEDMTISYARGGAGGGSALLSQMPRMAAVGNGRMGAGSALTPEYIEPERAPPGREAWMVGGGDDAAVVYDRLR
jgi:hypothetical protein